MSTYTVHQRVLWAIASECNSFSKFCNVFHPQPFYSRVSLYIDIQIKLTVILQALKHNLYLHPHLVPNLVIVVDLVCLNDTQSSAGWDVGP